jgi:hypothetical protein
LNEDLAVIYRAHATNDRPLKITSPRNERDLLCDAGTRVTIVVVRFGREGHPGAKRRSGGRPVGPAREMDRVGRFEAQDNNYKWLAPITHSGHLWAEWRLLTRVGRRQ